MYCSKYDLYSKSKVLVDVEQVKPYYISLINKVKIHLNIISLITKLVIICLMCIYFFDIAVFSGETKMVR